MRSFHVSWRAKDDYSHVQFELTYFQFCIVPVVIRDKKYRKYQLSWLEKGKYTWNIQITLINLVCIRSKKMYPEQNFN